MLVNILLVAVITVYAGFVIAGVVKEQKKAKQTGVPAGCCGCEAYKKGMCKSHTNCH